MGCMVSSASSGEPAKLHKTVWFMGCAASGKSWSADFCGKYHDWIHIDGDHELTRTDPKKVDMWDGICDTFETIFANKQPTEAMYGPYVLDLIKKAADARAANPDKTVVVAFAVYKKAMRDFVRKNSKEPVSFANFMVDKPEFLRRQMKRTEKDCETYGLTKEAAWVEWGLDQEIGAYGEGCWDKMFLKNDIFSGFENFRKDE